MDELIKVLNIFVKLKCFIVNVRNNIEDMPGYYVFTIAPGIGTEFDATLYELLYQSIPADISCNKSRMNIKFSASPVDQKKLVDAFFEVLKLHLVHERDLYAVLKPYLDEQPFVRLLNDYKKTKAASTEKKITEKTPVVLTPVISVEPPVIQEKKVKIAAVAATPPSLPHSTQTSSTFYYTTSGIVSGQPPQPSAEDSLHWQLQNDLDKIVKLMDAATTPPRMRYVLDFYGGLSNVAQRTKNILNPLMGDADAAINLKDKLRVYAKVMDRHFNWLEIEDIMALITSRLLHVQQDHLKDTHKEEITFLTSAEKRARDIREYLKQQGFIPSPESVSLLIPASQGYHS